MNFCPVAGIDVSKRFSDMCILSPDNKIFAQEKIYHDETSINRANTLLQKAEQIFSSKPVIVMESTSHYHLILFQFFSEHGYDVIVVNPLQSSSMKDFSIRKRKTDRVDAFKLAMMYRTKTLRPSQVSQTAMRALRQLCRERVEFLNDVSSYKNRLTAFLDQAFPGYDKVFSDLGGITSCAVLVHFPTPAILLAAEESELVEVIAAASKSGYERLFKPEHDKHCWLKADPSFEGLMQIVYEPGARVRIQKNYPGEKDPHQIIESITFSDENFQQEPVVFNDSLTCIIGGKSTGKSLLLRQLASTIDLPYVKEQEKISLYPRKPFDVKGATVLWKDGTTEGRKIVYIPQTYLNKTIDNPEESTAISKIIESVLLQEPDIHTAYDVFKDKIEKIKRKTQTDIRVLIETLQKLKNIEEEIKREGTSSTFEETIKTLESQRGALAEKVNISQAEIDRFRELERKIQTVNSEISTLTTELGKLTELESPAIVIPGYFESLDGFSIQHYLRDDFPQSESSLQDLIDQVSKNINSLWEPAIDEIQLRIKTKIESKNKMLGEFHAEYDILKDKVAQNAQLQKLTIRIADEEAKLQSAKTRELQRDSYKKKYNDLKTNILKSQSDYLTAYQEYGTAIRSTGTKKIRHLFLMQRWSGNVNHLSEHCLVYSTTKTIHHFELDIILI